MKRKGMLYLHSGTIILCTEDQKSQREFSGVIIKTEETPDTVFHVGCYSTTWAPSVFDELPEDYPIIVRGVLYDEIGATND